MRVRLRGVRHHRRGENMADIATAVTSEPRIQRVAVAVDEFVNAALMPDLSNIKLASDPHATVSAVLGEMIVNGTPEQKDIATTIDKMLTWTQINVFGDQPNVSHCVDAYIADKR